LIVRRAFAVLLFAPCAFAPGPALAASQSIADLPDGGYALEANQSSITAQVMHLGVSFYTLRFDGFRATLAYDPAHPEAARVRATVDATSLDVGADYSGRFAQEFLAADKFPTVTFVSTRIEPGVGGHGTMTGDLTLRGVTRPVTFEVAFDGVGKGLFGGVLAGFTATTTIKRSEFGSDFLQNVVGDAVKIEIQAEFARK